MCFLRRQLRIIADWTWKNLTLNGMLVEVLCELLFISCSLSLCMKVFSVTIELRLGAVYFFAHGGSVIL